MEVSTWWVRAVVPLCIFFPFFSVEEEEKSNFFLISFIWSTQVNIGRIAEKTEEAWRGYGSSALLGLLVELLPLETVLKVELDVTPETKGQQNCAQAQEGEYAPIDLHNASDTPSG